MFCSSFRTRNIDNDDWHFAFRTDDFEGALATLTAKLPRLVHPRLLDALLKALGADVDRMVARL